MKKIFLAIFLAMLPTLTYADAVEIDGLWYNIIEKGVIAEVTRNPNVSIHSSWISGDIKIPEKVSYAGNEYPVTKIYDKAFSDCSGLTSITIPNSVTSIGKGAFSCCCGLASITIPNSVTSIGKGAFSGCSGLTSITIPNSVTSIGSDAFIGTAWYNNKSDGLVYAGKVAYRYKGGMPDNTEIMIKDGTTGIAGQAFSGYAKGCSGLVSITIPNSVTSIGDEAFWYCSSLTSITIPNSVTSIGNEAFSGCSGLVSVTIPNSVTSIGSGAFYGTAWYENKSDGLVYAGKVAYKYKGKMPDNTEITIKDGTIGIARSAFEGCSGLTSITIPNSVTSIGDYAFWDCSSLVSIKVESGNQYYDSRDDCNAIIDSSNKLIVGCKNTIIPNSVTSIGDYAFRDCSGLTSINIPNSVTSIGDEAFFRCGGLTSITIPNSVTSIGNSAFSDCSDLTSITIPNSVTSIGSSAFRDCSGLTSITIPNSVTSIGAYAFYGTAWYNNKPDGLVYAGKVAYKFKGKMPDNTEITIKDGTIGIARRAFEGCSGLTSITIPNSVTAIGYRAFRDCSGLTSITIPNNVTSIDSSAFSRCRGLISIKVESGNKKYDSRNDCNAIIDSNNKLIVGCKNTIIPNSVTCIGDDAFWGCSGLTSITIPNSVTSIGNSAFSGCSDLTSITIPNSVTCISDEAFYNCSGLTSITIPNSVTSIGWSAFSGCSGLTSITIPNSVTYIGDHAFSGCNGLNSISIPNSVTIIDYGAFSGCSGLTSITIPNSVTYIGNRVFEGCTNLTSIKSLGKVPPSVPDITYFYTYYYLIDKTNCVIWVPSGSVEAYKAADGWKDFLYFKEIADGDVNIDEKVNRSDQNQLISHIMGEKPEGFYESLADLNGDYVVNVADLVKIIDQLNSGGLSIESQFDFDNVDGNLVASSLICTLNNERNEAILLTKCELYLNGDKVSYKSYSGNSANLAAGDSKSCTFNNLDKHAANTGFTVAWHYTVDGEAYVYRVALED